MSTTKKRKQPTLDPGSHVPILPSAAKRVHHTVTSGSTSLTRTRAVGKQLSPTKRKHTEAAQPEELNPEIEPEALVSNLKKARTQNGQLLDDFESHFEELGWLLLEKEANCTTDMVCGCGSGKKRTTKCFDCLDYSTTCPDCLVHAHINNPTHWAEVWDSSAGFFIRHENSITQSNSATTDELQPPNKVRQLMRAGLFPATAKDPHTAFTINMLKDFQLHNFESKKAAYDHLGAIRRLTDNSFTADVPNPYAAFLRVVRVFNYLTLVKRAGQLHGIDTLLSHRPNGNLLVWCPACPEPGFNSDPNCPKTPHHLRHLNQSQRTLDGNHQFNQFSKNTDPDDISLCNGKGYFPLDSEYQAHLKTVKPTADKSTCNYLKVVNKQDKKKIKNMAITGTVNCQCSHVFILSSVDLPHAERFANADYALAMALRNRRPKDDFEFKLEIEVNDVDEAATYDIACEYGCGPNFFWPQPYVDLADTIKKIRWGVPALHVNGHQDSCTYLFGTAYMECIAHFHGETAEHYWPESNQLGPHTRQMNLGHRQDTIIAHHGDWNHKKTSKIAFDLAEDIQDAKRKYVEKRNHFIALSISYSEHLPQWQSLDRSPTKIGKEAVSVYKHDLTKGNSLTKSHLRKMLSDQENLESSMVPKSRIARFLDCGIKIQDNQRKLATLLKDTSEHELQSRKTEAENLTTKLRTQISEFRKAQTEIMPKTAERVRAQALTPPSLEVECLYLPSDFDDKDRKTLGLAELAVEEAKWREGEAYDILRALQNVVKAVSALRNRKRKNERQQKQNTRAVEYITETLKKQTHHMDSYSAVHGKISTLNGSCFLPKLTEKDLFMKSVQQKKRVGDSKRTDGLLFWAAALNTASALTTANGEFLREISSSFDSHTRQYLLTKSKAKSCGRGYQKPSPRGRRGMDLESGEGDRVQWFRAEADMQRWQEQIEQKLAELSRTRRSFKKMESVWTELATSQPSDRPGAAAYARQKAAMYQKRSSEAHNKLRELGYENLLREDANIVQFVEEERKKQADVDFEALLAMVPRIQI
ncbi:hypothetical protein R3P38DRAFT_3332856 [Favolaschia claudopus]|uniref:CxC2-like cysteine cluster KDZ transposase-associated domain-containing protein n=1 Tax=Favolaschia claudopus TaxID=2862362 RepID=A0AAV9ZJ32_9AGAR